MLITLTQLKKSLQALKDFLLAKITVKDVQVNGTSILDEGVANVPIASASNLGAVKVPQYKGLTISATGELSTQVANDAHIKSGTTGSAVIDPLHQHKSVFYGLAKVAGHDEKDSTLSVGTYSDEAKTAIKSMIGVEEPIDVQINGTSIVDSGVANIPKASASSAGVISASSAYGIGLNVQGGAYISGAALSEIKKGTSSYKPVTVSGQHQAAFYGLAKAAGDTTQSASSNPVGTYTDEAKASIKTMLGVEDPVDVQINGTSIVDNGVANIPVASGGNLGVVKTFNGNFYGINVYSGELRIASAPDSDIKSGWGSYQPITAGKQHTAVFYGLAKAAGHDEKSSTLPVGTYTDEAKAAIKTMLGITVDSIPTTEIDTLFA